MERADDGGRVNIRDIVLYPAEPLYILTETLASLLGNDVQVACLAMGLVASSKGANKLMAQIRPEEIESTGKCINHDMALGLRANGK